MGTRGCFMIERLEPEGIEQYGRLAGKDGLGLLGRRGGMGRLVERSGSLIWH